MEEIEINVVVNNKKHRARVSPRILLSDFLRHQLKLFGTHVGCEHGVCGACSVLVDDALTRSCLMFAVQADGCRITTVESLGTVKSLHPLQEAFWEEHGLQCGYCTPGMLMAATELLNANPDPTEEQVREAISGNLCPCTGYQNIVKSIMSAAKKIRDKSGAAA